MATNSTEKTTSIIKRNAFFPLDLNFSSRILTHIALNNTENIPSFTVDENLFKSIRAFVDKFYTYSESAYIEPKKSSPCIFAIILEIVGVIDRIFDNYKKDLGVLNNIEYFNVTSQNLLKKLKEVIKSRTEFIKTTLILSHILADLKAMFPESVYEGHKFRIKDSEAAEFWNYHFKDKTIVPWRYFEEKLSKVFRYFLNFN